MGTKNKTDFTNKCMALVPGIFGILLLLCVLFLITASWVMPSEGGKPAVDCEIFESEWYHVLEDGGKEAVEVPGKVEARRGELVTLTTILPKEIKGGESIFFRASLQNVTVYIDGELRAHYDTI